ADRVHAIGNVNLFLAFRQSRDRQLFDAEFRERRTRGVELSAAAVDQDHVRQRLRLIDQASIPPIDRLGHGSEVVRADDRADVEDAILVLVELPAVENDHSGDRVAALNVRNVERLDLLDVAILIAEDLREPRGGDLQTILLRFSKTRLVREARVAIRELDAVHAPAALRHAHGNLAARLRRQPVGDQFLLLDVERKQDLGRDEEIVLIVALQDLAEKISRPVIGDFLPEQLAAIDDVAVAHDEELHRDAAALFVESPLTHLFVLRRRDLLLGLD